METYQLTITTNKRFSGAGTNDTVQVMITGDSQNATKWTTLDLFFVNDFEAGATQSYTVTHSGTIGAPVMLSFRLILANPLSGILGDGTWMCNKVDVQYKGASFLFPVYDWITTTEQSFAVGKATLPQNVTLKCLTDMRSKQIKLAQTMYEWNPTPASSTDTGWDMNRYLLVTAAKPLPLMFQNTVNQTNRTLNFGLGSAVNAGLNVFQGFTGVLQKLDDYKNLYLGTGHKDPYFINDWKTDVEMGRQTLTGISPLAMKRCTALPTYCNVTDADVAKSMPAGKSLQSEMQAGKIYISDYSYAAPVKRNTIPLTNKQFVTANCIGLFYADANKDFIPIAIQLVPSDKTSIFTPSDTEYDWLLAKMYFRSTQGCFHEWIYHYFLTHAVSETFAVATFRGFPQCHPLYKLLRPHLRAVCKINTDARSVLLPDVMLANQAIALNAIDTVRNHYKTFSIAELDLPAQLKAKGLDDKTLLPNYPYRDDALDLWNAITTYVTNVIKFYYKSDSDVAGDTELQAWANDLAHTCFGWQDGNTRGMPDKITTIAELVRICTMAIFCSSAQHAAVNFGQMDTYQFIPNASPCMVLPVHKKGEGSLKRVMDTLPDVTKSTILITFAYALSMYAKDEAFLGDVIEQLFTEPEVIAMENGFKQELVKLGTKFVERNKNLFKYPYTYLYPDKIPIDINI